EAMKEKAKQEGKKRLLLIFGANWCGDCMAMDRILGEKEIQNVLAESYLLMKVDIGHFDKNLDFVRRFGNPIEKGIPSFVIIDEAGSILVSTNNGKFSKARKMKSESVLEFLLQYH
ncbi:MAG: thioredoxin family protein, partial [Leptospiraceae bacterium]|nr:thioredoxin family protein [Leptospiraceae bacterium]